VQQRADRHSAGLSEFGFEVLKVAACMLSPASSTRMPTAWIGSSGQPGCLASALRISAKMRSMAASPCDASVRP
jgi:hypothetical protein